MTTTKTTGARRHPNDQRYWFTRLQLEAWMFARGWRWIETESDASGMRTVEFYEHATLTQQNGLPCVVTAQRFYGFVHCPNADWTLEQLSRKLRTPGAAPPGTATKDYVLVPRDETHEAALAAEIAAIEIPQAALDDDADVVPFGDDELAWAMERFHLRTIGAFAQRTGLSADAFKGVPQDPRGYSRKNWRQWRTARMATPLGTLEAERVRLALCDGKALNYGLDPDPCVTLQALYRAASLGMGY